jgi:hypothetical protein
LIKRAAAGRSSCNQQAFDTRRFWQAAHIGIAPHT